MNIIEEFKKVRDIPYRIPLSLKDKDECCSGKANKLFEIFKKSNYEVRYRLCLFRWSDLNLPKEIKNISHEEESSHTYLEVKIDDKWKIIDATWDVNLKSIFCVNEWDGRTNTKLAVPVKRLLSPKKSLEYIKKTTTPEAVVADLKVNGPFYKAFNEWLEKKRK